MNRSYRACTTVFAMLLASAAPAALAQKAPNCHDPQTQMEMTQCAGLDYEVADRDLNAAYREAIASMKEMDSYLPDAQKGAERTLREAQRAWIPFRDKACESYGYQAHGGSMESMLVLHCLADLTLRRTVDLRELTDGLAN